MSINEDVYYYITTLNENYPHPAMPEGAEEGILRGVYKLREVKAGQPGLKVRLLGAGAILREVEAAAEMLAEEHGVSSEVFSVTSFTELRREGIDAERWIMLHPESRREVPYVTKALSGGTGPVIASTDYMKALADGVRAYVPGALQGARHRRVRPLRLSQKAALVLRGRPLPCRGGEPEGAGGRAVAARQAGVRGDRQIRHRSGRAESGAQLKSRHCETTFR